MSPLERERVDLERQRVGLYGRDVATREANQQRLQQSDRERRERLGATLKTFEALAVDTAQKTFPDDPVKRMAFAERLRQRVKGLGALLSGDENMATIEAKFLEEIRKAKGEFVSSVPEGRAQVDSYWSRLGNAIFGRTSAPTVSSTQGLLPGETPTFDRSEDAFQEQRARERDPGRTWRQLSREGKRAASNAMVNALYPGRTWHQLTPEEKKTVVNRMNGGR